ncbi:Dihydropteroate synthase [Desulfitobacterium dichloroeliminans LMG P-21439]|uniref:Dihydropteroate synthase n=1 Tax=Desulfitobacterium dichloroeliminans (strain LMG P-21439 / DCA1) TaxID=871963 RepID=L0F4R2_DESDL|nr:dihydropteroate synthase [Desulfitobacterium dichloroeliminans]AGA67656.1 Dihydropteroate synthase [Desulfitobacterium dichloroeliminans LMG P-21439]
MKDFHLRWIKLDNETESKKAMEIIGSDPGGIAQMAGKPLGRALKIENVPLHVAHILKQEMLSLGGDAAVHRNVIVNKIEATDMLLVGTVKQFRKLSQKLLAQPFGLKDLGKTLRSLLEGFEPPQKRVLSCRGKELILGERTLIMGILNLTPDSFSDGGKYVTLDQALKQAEILVEQGADILDIGAESTRPSHDPVGAKEEWERLEAVLKALVPRLSIPISLDTYKAEVAERALDIGVHIINDVWGLQRDSRMAEVVGKYQAPVVVMHNQEGDSYHHVIGDIIAFLKKSIYLAEEQGLKGDQIIIDPGIGGSAFGKNLDLDLEIMSRLSEFRSLGHPILLGTSRKSMIGQTLNLPLDQRLEGTIATSVVGVAAGVDILRVHDVLPNKRAVQMADAIYRQKRGANFVGA